MKDLFKRIYKKSLPYAVAIIVAVLTFALYDRPTHDYTFAAIFMIAGSIGILIRGGIES